MDSSFFDRMIAAAIFSIQTWHIFAWKNVGNGHFDFVHDLSLISWTVREIEFHVKYQCTILSSMVWNDVICLHTTLSFYPCDLASMDITGSCCHVSTWFARVLADATSTLSSLALLKSRMVFTFLVPAYPGCPGEEAIKWVFVWLVCNRGLIWVVDRSSVWRWLELCIKTVTYIYWMIRWVPWIHTLAGICLHRSLATTACLLARFDLLSSDVFVSITIDFSLSSLQ